GRRAGGPRALTGGGGGGAGGAGPRGGGAPAAGRGRCGVTDVEALLAWFAREGADLPWRRTRDRYSVLVAEVMLQSTQVPRVVPYYERWTARWPTPEALAAAPLGEVLAAWHGLGFPRRARNLHAAARAVAAGGWPPDDRLADLPGVGPYTAAAILCLADGRAVLPVHTNLRRALARRFPGCWPGTPPGRRS